MTSRIEPQLSNSRGFTLIELMISISILSMLLFLGAYSYSLFSDRWNRELGKFVSYTDEATNLENFQRAMEGIQSFVVVDNNEKPSFFFIGSNKSLLAITASGLFSGRYPEIFRLTALNNQDGTVNLLYQATSTKDFLLTGTEQTIEFSNAKILFENIDSASLRYYGWESLRSQTSNDNGLLSAKWFDDYSGIDRQLMPEKLNISIEKSGQFRHFPVILEADSKRWLSPYMKSDS